jgi:hypothetical protein
VGRQVHHRRPRAGWRERRELRGDRQPANPPVGIELGGDWSTSWYNGFIYESDITRGLIIWNLSDKAVAGARKLDHLNPQTQEFNID